MKKQQKYTKLLLELRKHLSDILANEVCKYQSLDNARDRTRVRNEIFKMLITKYEFKRL